MIQIIPAILSTKEEDFQRDVERYNSSSSFQEGWVHIDFMDNIFVPNLSIGPSVVTKYPINLRKEAHIMVSHPLEWIDKLERVGFERIFFHIEAKDDVEESISQIKSKNIEVGLTLNIETPVEKLEPFVDKIDRVLLMAIVPGFQGQPFKPEVIDKIKETSRLRSKNNSKFLIGLDGAVNDKNARKLVDAGVDYLIVGSFLLKGDIDENLEKIWQAAGA